MSSNQNLFNQSYNEIQKSILGDGAKNFQMFAKPVNFAWPVAGPGEMSPEAYQIVSFMPQYNELAEYNPGDATFYDAYKSVLGHITFKVSDEKLNDLQNLQNALTAAQKKMNDTTTTLNNAYLQAKQNGGITFSELYATPADWMNDGPGSAYKDNIAKAVEAVKAAQKSYYDLQKSLDPTDALAEANDKVQKPANPPSGGDAKDGWVKVKNAGGVMEWQPAFDLGTDGQKLKQKLTAGTSGSFTVNLDASKETSNMDKKWAGGSASYGNFFWGVSGSGGWERLNIAEEDQSVKVIVSAKSSTVVPVTPGSWYKGGFMREIARNNTNSGYKITQGWSIDQGKNALFGKEGLLSCRINQLVVVFGLSVEIQMNSSTFNKYYQKIEAGGGLRIGPFRFGGHGGSETMKITKTSNGTGFKVEDTSSDPQVIGITVAFPGIGG